MNFRKVVMPKDLENVREILKSSGFFHDFEIDIAVELVDENLAKGDKLSGYYFVFAEDESRKTVGYTCFGEIPCTEKRYDLYWIGVHESMRGRGLGKELLKITEENIKELAGEIVYIETSSRDIYIPTRAFYEKCGYVTEAILKDFYANNDGKYIFSKRISAN